MFLLAPAAMMLYYNQEKLGECEEASRTEKIRGNYENKIRYFAPPEKMFEIFSTVKTEDGEMRMSYFDFFHTMTPFNYCHKDEDCEKLVEEWVTGTKHEIISIVDSDNDGSISFTEFFFFLTI